MKWLAQISHHIRVFSSERRERKKMESRSGRWPAVRAEHLKTNPECEACGHTKNLQVHHMQPFHEKPELELEPTNLISLCMGPHECHIRIGHGGSFDHWNPNVRTDANLVRLHPERRPHIEQLAKQNRRVNAPE
jgi:5-methylcytosine-specific restriction enzyme A